VRELSPFVPAALGLACGVLVWAIICAFFRKKKTSEHDGCC
jgi:uncharacterized transporter YbjL